MSYKTFEIIDGELFINDIAPITARTIENIDKMLKPTDTVQKVIGCDEPIYGYHEQADDECIMLDDDIYFD